MPEFIAGAAIIVGLLVLLFAFANASPRTLARAVRYAGVGVLAMIAGGLIYIRQFVLGFFFGSMAWGLYTNGHIWPTRNFFFTPFGFAWRTSSRTQARRPGATRGQTSQVATAWLEIELSHDTGEMRGRVLKGAFANRSLTSLAQEQLLALYREAAPQDGETARLLEAYLDRRLGPEWRLADHKEEAPREEAAGNRGRNRDSGMSREEAFHVLGLGQGASEADIRAAHRKLMMQNHPDHGGSSYLAAKINEAKDVLLG
jgi:hypothetical protein